MQVNCEKLWKSYTSSSSAIKCQMTFRVDKCETSIWGGKAILNSQEITEDHYHSETSYCQQFRKDISSLLSHSGRKKKKKIMKQKFHKHYKLLEKELRTPPQNSITRPLSTHIPIAHLHLGWCKSFCSFHFGKDFLTWVQKTTRGAVMIKGRKSPFCMSCLNRTLELLSTEALNKQAKGCKFIGREEKANRTSPLKCTK